MKNTIFVILILIIFSSFSCSVKCPCMNEEDLTWFPYTEGDTLTYINKKSDTLKLQIDIVAISNEYEQKYKYRNECSTSAVINANNANDSSFDIKILNREWQNSKSISFRINMNEGKMHTKGYLSVLNVYDSKETNTINQVYYEEVVLCEKDTLQFDDDIWKAYLAKGYGIVQFHDRTTGYIWNLVHE